MKFIIIPFIALGLILSLAIGIEYRCLGEEAFPVYYGSPFIFEKTSLGSSLIYYFSISGLILNVMIWSVVLSLLDIGINKLVKAKVFNIVYKFSILILILFSTFNLILDFEMIGDGFSEHTNYWYWNMNNEAKEWSVVCEGEIVSFVRCF